jgi:hypothetical protein
MRAQKVETFYDSFHPGNEFHSVYIHDCVFYISDAKLLMAKVFYCQCLPM